MINKFISKIKNQISNIILKIINMNRVIVCIIIYTDFTVVVNTE